MELLELDLKRPRLNVVGGGTLPKTATQRLLALLSQDEVCRMNSFDTEDYYIEDAKFPVLLSEHKRFDLYLRSISASASHRFRTVVEHFSISGPKEQTVIKLMGMIQNAEQSKSGQIMKGNERLKHPDWETNLHHYLAGLQGDSYVPPADLVVSNVKIGTPHPQTTTAAQAHVSFAGDSITSSTLICRNPKHKHTTNHHSNDCRLEPWRTLWLAGKLNLETGLPLDGSQLPTKLTSAPQATVPPATGPPTHGASNKKAPRYNGPPCEFCSSHPELKKCAPTHDISTCRIKDSFVKRKGNTSSSQSSAHVATSDVSAQVAQLSQNMLQITKLLSGKKRKAEEGEMDQSS